MKILLLSILFLAATANAQSSFQLSKSGKNSFRFEINGNLVIVPVKINGLNLSFLLDTGVKETILFISKEDSIPLENVHQVRFSGIGIEDGVAGMLSTGNEMEIGGVLVDSAHTLYAIDAEELDISSHVGIPINGIVGSHFFQHHLIKIDYQKRKISLYDAFDYPDRLVRGYTRIPIEIERNRPYTQIAVQLKKQTPLAAKMLVDMGNSDGLLIFPFLVDSLEISKPFIYDYIGKGFSGVIYGYRNRIRGFDWAGFHIHEPIVSYPDSNAVHAAKLAKHRKGSVGNQVLQHFHVLFNYPLGEMYLKPNRKFGKPFSINMTGLDVRHDGLEWKKSRVRATLASRSEQADGQGITVFQDEAFRYEFSLKPVYIIGHVRKGSPGDLAGARPGDELLRIDGKRVQNMKLQQIIGRLHRRRGDLMKMLIRRGEEELQLKFKLVDPIPFDES